NYADSVWLLAGDDGFNGNWPELAGRAQATTDRDVYFWRMWGDPSDRPWFPIANIMTHGIIRNAGGQMSYKTDLPRDWSDYVLMHYGRGRCCASGTCPRLRCCRTSGRRSSRSTAGRNPGTRT
ncbi:hypothetical protein EMGBD4_13100, partial [Verrucomicrobiota bacterium]